MGHATNMILSLRNNSSLLGKSYFKHSINQSSRFHKKSKYGYSSGMSEKLRMESNKIYLLRVEENKKRQKNSKMVHLLFIVLIMIYFLLQ